MIKWWSNEKGTKRLVIPSQNHSTPSNDDHTTRKGIPQSELIVSILSLTLFQPCLMFKFFVSRSAVWVPIVLLIRPGITGNLPLLSSLPTICSTLSHEEPWTNGRTDCVLLAEHLAKPGTYNLWWMCRLRMYLLRFRQLINQLRADFVMVYFDWVAANCGFKHRYGISLFLWEIFETPSPSFRWWFLFTLFELDTR